MTSGPSASPKVLVDQGLVERLHAAQLTFQHRVVYLSNTAAFDQLGNIGRVQQYVYRWNSATVLCRQQTLSDDCLEMLRKVGEQRFTRGVRGKLRILSRVWWALLTIFSA
jgi:hypothetical protein